MTIRGQMIHRLQLQQRESVTNDHGETIEKPKWSVVTKCWAKIMPISGSEFSQADAQQAKITDIIQIWNIRGKTDKIRSSMRFFDPLDGSVYNLTGYKKEMIQRDRIITCQCIQDESRLNVEGA